MQSEKSYSARMEIQRYLFASFEASEPVRPISPPARLTSSLSAQLARPRCLASKILKPTPSYPILRLSQEDLSFQGNQGNGGGGGDGNNNAGNLINGNANRGVVVMCNGAGASGGGGDNGGGGSIMDYFNDKVRSVLLLLFIALFLFAMHILIQYFSSTDLPVSSTNLPDSQPYHLALTSGMLIEDQIEIWNVVMSARKMLGKHGRPVRVLLDMALGFYDAAEFSY